VGFVRLLALSTLLLACGGGYPASPPPAGGDADVVATIDSAGVLHVGCLLWMPQDTEFGPTVVHRQSVRKVTVTSTCDHDAWVASVTSDINPFNCSLACQPGATCPRRTIAPGASLQVSFEYQPVRVGQEDMVHLVLETSEGRAELLIHGSGAPPS
jgi:hypothetical protein